MDAPMRLIKCTADELITTDYSVVNGHCVDPIIRRWNPETYDLLEETTC